MKKIIISGCLMLSIATATIAQTETINGGAGHFRFGYSNHNMKGMNNWLSDRYPTLRNDFVCIGGTGYGIINNVIIGGEGFGAIGPTVSKDTLSISPSLGRGMFNIGYVVYHKNNLLVYPLAGFGGGAVSFKFKEIDGADHAMNKVKTKDYELSSGNLLLCLAVGADKFFPSNEGEGGFSLGIRLGYTYAFQNQNWKKDDAETGGPLLNPSGFFVTIGFGGGGWSVHKNQKVAALHRYSKPNKAYTWRTLSRQLENRE